MIVDRTLVRNSSTTTAARIEPTTRCSSTLWIEASMKSEASRHHADGVARRQRRLQLVDFSRAPLSRPRRCWSPIAGGPAAARCWRRSRSPRLSGSALAVLGAGRRRRCAPDVRPWLADDDVVELGDGLHAAARAQRDRLRSLVDAAAGDLDVLALQARARTSVTVRL